MRNALRWPVIDCIAAPNAGNTQWNWTSAGQIQLASNPSLCMTGPKATEQTAFPLTLEKCTANNTAQAFSYVNSTTDPYVTVMQGLSVVGTSGNSLVLFPPNNGAGLFPCNSSSLEQNIVFTGGGGIPGQLRNALDQCISGRCDSPACYPVPFVQCDNSDTTQLWVHDFENAFVNAASGDCLDAYNGVVCLWMWCEVC